ncbi:flap endonuclease GEN homolog 1-like, partial [Ruditapes philippinarum]|uniref:flap endonuclease GEN homolog 1-like n=1 Tax=Ruditapes philippinarum TaxID=129788 RepID=UPI00295AE0EC
MGVTQLWQILAPVEQHRALSSLSGQTLAVDLSIWVCENQCVKQMQGVVSKPYLRNLFFRISHLTQLGVKLVFVIEGAAPELKWDTMIKRQQSRFPGRQGKQAPQRPAGKQTRRNFNSWLKECCELLEILGIPYIQSKGEAEALCALLNANGLVDGCLTNDGDAFLYGATTVYRNFTMNSKDPHVEMYRLSDIQSKLGIDRGGLVALGLLIGCDFVPKGVPGIGIANAVRLLQSLQGQDILIRLQSWSTMSEKECVDQTEILARRKAIQVPDFPQIK